MRNSRRMIRYRSSPQKLTQDRNEADFGDGDGEGLTDRNTKVLVRANARLAKKAAPLTAAFHSTTAYATHIAAKGVSAVLRMYSNLAERIVGDVTR